MDIEDAEFEIRKENYLSEEHKKLKHRFMCDLMNVFMYNIQYCHDEMQDPRLSTDLLTSIIVMFSREMILHFVSNSNIANERGLARKLIEHIVNEIKKSIFERLDEELKEKSQAH